MRLAFLQSIHERLDSGRFKAADFEIVQRKQGTQYSFTVTYRYDPRYRVTATIAASGGLIRGSITPGEVAETENFEVEGRYQFLTLIDKWKQAIAEELSTAPTLRQLEEQAAQIEKLVGSLQEMPDEYFSKAEADLLREKLEQLEQQILERLQQAGLQDAVLKAKVKEVEADVEVLKETLESLKKPGWAKSFATRVGGWMCDPNTRALLKDGVDVARKLLGPGGPAT